METDNFDMSTRVHGSCDVVSCVKDPEEPPFHVWLREWKVDGIRVAGFDTYFM